MPDLTPVMNGSEKHALVLEYARPYGVLVETGLWNGGGATTALAGQLTCYAIDVDYGNVVKAREAGVEAYQGDSAVMLPQLLERIHKPCCFWLDAHMVAELGDDPVQGVYCPVLAEIEAVRSWEHGASSTVLVDDLRMFGRDGWPNLQELRDLVWAGPWLIDERDDILRLTPRS